MKTEQEIIDKIKELEEEYQYMTPYDVEYVYLPKQIKILKWVLGKERIMRKINFRAWDKKNGMWLNRFNVNLLDIEDLSIVEINQYTGLKDIAGDEIYEGDIVKWKNRENDVFKYAKVFFEDGAFRLYNTYFELNKYENLEVVGNIYENPEICCK